MTKEELREFRSRKKEIDDLRERLERMEAGFGPKSPQTNGVPGGKGTPSDPTGNQATAHAALEDFYRMKLVELEAEQLRIERAINSLPYEQRKILRAYYLDGLTWEAVCVAVGYEWAQTHRLHAKALIALADK